MWNPKSSDHIYFPPVEITSPEQYVPYYLAYQSSTVPEDHSNYYPCKVPINYSRKRLTRSKLKELLVKQLNLSYPERYSIPIREFEMINPGVSGSDNITYSAYAFNGTNGVDHYLTQHYLTLPGFITAHSGFNFVASLGNNYYQTQPLGCTLPKLNPLMLLLIKAKHIPLVRAFAYLQSINVELPLNDMKLLAMENVLTSDHNEYMRQMYRNGLQDFISREGLTTKYATKAEFLTYLVGDSQPKTAGEIIRDAIGLRNGDLILSV